MKTPSLERFYFNIDRAIRLAQSYSEIKELMFILKSCRMKPYSIFYEKEIPRLKLYRHWFDEFGNSLYITKRKRIKTVYNDLLLRKREIVCTDLYYGLSLDKIVKLSKIIHLVIGKNEDTHEYYLMITFYGIDGYLRSYLYDGEWKQASPFMLGMKRLKNIHKHSDVKYFHQLKNLENFMTPCATTDEWIGSLTQTSVGEFVKILKKKYEIDFSFLISN